MDEFFRGYVAVDAEDVPRVFTLPQNVYASNGDCIEYDGEMFVVTDEITMIKDTAEYRLVMDLATVLEADAVFCRRWSKE